MTNKVIPPSDPKYPEIRSHIIWDWIRTFIGFGMMGGLILGAMWLFNLPITAIWGAGLFWLLFPVVMWLASAQVSLKLMKCEPVDMSVPEYAQAVEWLKELLPMTGMKHLPPVYISEDERPNAFATGPFPAWGVIGITKGFFKLGLTKGEFQGVLAHELSHIKKFDVGVNSMTAAMSMIFFMVFNVGMKVPVQWVINLFKRLLGMPLRAENQKIFGGVAEWIIFYLVFQVTGKLTSLVQMFIVRSREAGADALGSYMTGKPCDLAMALMKLVAYYEKNRPKGSEREFYKVLRPIMTIDPLYATMTVTAPPVTVWEKLKAFWAYLQLTHPPVSERVANLEKMNGGACPRP